MLTEERLAELIADVHTSETVALVLTGSYTRGDANRYSDVDLVHYVRSLPPESERYTLRYDGDTLVSLTLATLEAHRAELARPERAAYAAPGLRGARILVDTDGAFAALQAEAEALRWDTLQAEADAYASAELAGFAEEAHKIMGGLLKGDASQTVYAVLGLLLGIARMVTAQRGLLITSDNTYFRNLQEALGIESRWSRLMGIAAGMDDAPGPEPWRMRGAAALGLYVETAHLLDSILRSIDARVIHKTVDIITSSGFDQID